MKLKRFVNIFQIWNLNVLFWIKDDNMMMVIVEFYIVVEQSVEINGIMNILGLIIKRS